MNYSDSYNVAYHGVWGHLYSCLFHGSVRELHGFELSCSRLFFHEEVEVSIEKHRRSMRTTVI